MKVVFHRVDHSAGGAQLSAIDTGRVFQATQGCSMYLRTNRGAVSLGTFKHYADDEFGPGPMFRVLPADAVELRLDAEEL